MDRDFKQISRTGGTLVLVGAAALAISIGGAVAASRTASLGNSAAVPNERALYVSVGETSRPPIGWVEFCFEYKSECATRPTAPRDIVLTAKSWADLVKVNKWVNDTIKPITDQEQWGVVERWNYPDNGQGDCEDYVLLKRRMLIQAGWPREALLITVVRDKKGDGHAVLTVKTDRGEFILDNQETEVLPWQKTGYRFIKRQSQSDPNVWVSLNEPRNAPATVSAR
ncbi:MAG: transglutaminase-like cysteine peptidase [Pseudolabrys sp.]|nr:transglutaminase-like cysteine peptidase [Pseudolabrys sp.]